MSSPERHCCKKKKNVSDRKRNFKCIIVYSLPFVFLPGREVDAFKKDPLKGKKDE